MAREIQIQPLGKPVYLGQLYNATTSTFINENLFDPAQLVLSKPEPASGVSYDYRDIKSLESRAHSLDVSASLSVSVLCGALAVDGYGSYLDREDDSSDSHTIAVTARIRTKTERLDIPDNKKFVRLSGEQVQENGATHVVTAIEYGSNIVGTFTQKNTRKDSGRDVGGKLSIEVLKGMGRLLEVSGEAELQLEERRKLELYDCGVRLLADIQSESALPTNAADMLAIVVQATPAVGDGVPLNVYLTSLRRFRDRFNAVSLVQQLDTAQLTEILGFYDKYITLDRNRVHLRSQMDQHYRSYFPSFAAACRERATSVSQSLRHACRELRSYLQAYLSAKPGSAPNADFLTVARERYIDELQVYEADQTTFEDLVQRQKAADNYGFESINVMELKKLMNRTDDATIALVVIPESVHSVNLLNIYRVLADDIREWRRVEDSKRGDGDKGEITIYRSLYADPQLDDTLKLLDDADGTLMTAITSIRHSKQTGFLTFGVALKKLGELEWNSMNRDGWGILINKEEKWRYIGNVRNGLRHGSGVITYADETRYAGSWYKGRREGIGRLIDKMGAEAENVYINDCVRKDGVVVNATIFRNDIPIKFVSIALGGHDRVSDHVAKIAEVCGWKIGQRFDIILQSVDNTFKPVSVVANGPLTDVYSSSKASTMWPLDGQNFIKVNIIP
ncbi:hypothetical protein AX14_013427 [Amanita brunnescens Koide BX004]|nr:hypothetical protein AX14_013427 [Amanita brunnescens Koide BX004]